MDSQNLKLSTIREFKGVGLDVKYYIIRHNLTEQEAYLVKFSIIDLMTYPAFNKENILTNIVSGHHQWNEGIKTDEEINILYDCPKIKPIPEERLLLVSLNRSYEEENTFGQIAIYSVVNLWYDRNENPWIRKPKSDCFIQDVMVWENDNPQRFLPAVKLSEREG